jgi:hypothetical protein
MMPIAGEIKSRIVLLAGALAIIIGCCVAYIPAMKAGFIWDDDYYVTNNPLITSPGGLYRIWTSRAVTSQYFPLTYTTFWFEYRLWGFNPLGRLCPAPRYGQMLNDAYTDLISLNKKSENSVK